MASYTDGGMRPMQADGSCVAGASIADVLRLLSAGATGAILMALGDGPLRTKDLAARVPGYTPRTIYRYAGKLTELEIVEREEEPGVPSKVIQTLTDPCGSELYGLVSRFADASLTRLPDGRIDAQAWGALGLLADLWEAGMVEDLSGGARSPTELSRGLHGLSYHQVNRRAGLFKASGLLRELQGPRQRRCYALTEKTRRKMGLIAGIGSWRQDHVIAADEEGITAAEMATLLKVALPLTRLPQHAGKRLKLCVVAENEMAESEGEVAWLAVEEDGAVRSCPGPIDPVDAWGRGGIEAWIATILDGTRERISVGGDERVIGDCLDGLSTALWAPRSF